ncbi:MAG: hypothetical protein WCY82_11280 [Desulfotomaculaceae bacterium]
MNKNADDFKNAVLKAAIDGKLSCPKARQLAEELGVPAKEVRQVADDLKIKIFGCELGCFE